MFNQAELNYDVHDKELLTIYEAFKKWYHYLEGTLGPIDVVTDHKNLIYFSGSKLLTRRQACWSEYLAQFNLLIRFRPGHLGKKPNALTWRPDLYPTKGTQPPESTNLYNYCPLFTQEQLAFITRIAHLDSPPSSSKKPLDIKSLHIDIRRSLPQDSTTLALLANPTSSQDTDWLLDKDRLVRYLRRIFVPDALDLQLRILKYKHDHVLAGHFGQEKTWQLVERDYFWPELWHYVKDYVRSCNTCSHNKTCHYRLYGFLKQLSIPLWPWESISMDFIKWLPASDGFTDILVIVDHLIK